MKQAEVRREINLDGVDLCGIVETKVRRVNTVGIFRRMLHGWSLVTNNNSSLRGRIWVCWSPSIFDVKLLEQTDQGIHCNIVILANQTCFFLLPLYMLIMMLSQGSSYGIICF